ncbi:MAG: WecB/TagA/CpsF family glycosyltransferase [Bacteroidales bacterium]|jgi:N-acetylglucosaminyldiphosphoundecaprenol N-acetyl-beta-D-mannosaminyltransferase|nr:WecB/TagA/CpsF family glycosyltransferase [Bacteroidales bacterium]
MQKQPLISIDVSTGPYSLFCEKMMQLGNDLQGGYVCVANVHMLVEAYKDKNFADVVNRSTITTPDGLPLTWALKWLYGIKQDRVAGMDLLPDLLSLASQQNIPVLFYGGTEDVLLKTGEFLKEHYPGIPSVEFLSPPFRALTPEETDEMIHRINSSGAKLVFVALGCPKQEKWMASVHERVNALLVGIGGALPVMVGMQSRAPRWMQKCGLEWLYRLLQEPGRLWKRYFVTNTIFLYLLVKEKLRKKR